IPTVILILTYDSTVAQSETIFADLQTSQLRPEFLQKTVLERLAKKSQKIAGQRTQPKSVEGNPYYLGLVVALSVQFASLFLSCGLYHGLKQDGISFVQMFLNFFYKFLLCVVTNMILSRYRSLKSILKAYFQENKSYVSIHFMKQVENTMHTLKQNVGTYNDMLGWPIFLVISNTTFGFVDNIDYSIFCFKEAILWNIFEMG
ncbi:hypothetical protein BDFB_009177, partial [Asbolus verrucosus]